MNDGEKILVDCRTAAGRLDIGLTHFYRLVNEGRVHLIKLGRCSRVAVSELEELVETLRAEVREG